MKNLLKISALTLAFVGLLGLAVPSLAQLSGGRQSTNLTRTNANITIDGEDQGSVSELYADTVRSEASSDQASSASTDEAPSQQ